MTFIGANITYKGFLFGIKYIETIDDNFNPFFIRRDLPNRDLDSYSELVLTLNYTRHARRPRFGCRAPSASTSTIIPNGVLGCGQSGR